ncbi:MAG TPA: hypothetical protein GX513_11770 [Firmicutes bacterium]|nr:hypothetical protein [Bacillota bacterium]
MSTGDCVRPLHPLRPLCPLCLVEASGTPYEAGHAIGVQCQHQLAHLLACTQGEAGPRWGELVDRSKLYLEASRMHLPRRVQELEGAAAGAALPLPELFAAFCLEELCGYRGDWRRGCTDFVVAGKATSAGEVCACHNEDWNQEEAGDLVVVSAHIQGETPFLAVAYGGVLPSMGMNQAGLAVTGNALDQNDMQVGVPRVLLVREALGCPGLAEALQVAALPARASSYNNVFTSVRGDIYNFEGSATDFEISYSSTISVHTNHYLSPRMRRYEADPREMGTVVRYYTARRLLEEQMGHITLETCQRILADHTHAPYSICRHPRPERPPTQTVTTFAAICDLTHGRLLVCPGNPCQGEYTEYTLAPETARPGS